MVGEVITREGTQSSVNPQLQLLDRQSEEVYSEVLESLWKTIQIHSSLTTVENNSLNEVGTFPAFSVDSSVVVENIQVPMDLDKKLEGRCAFCTAGTIRVASTCSDGIKLPAPARPSSPSALVLRSLTAHFVMNGRLPVLSLLVSALAPQRQSFHIYVCSSSAVLLSAENRNFEWYAQSTSQDLQQASERDSNILGIAQLQQACSICADKRAKDSSSNNRMLELTKGAGLLHFIVQGYWSIQGQLRIEPGCSVFEKMRTLTILEEHQAWERLSGERTSIVMQQVTPLIQKIPTSGIYLKQETPSQKSNDCGVVLLISFGLLGANYNYHTASSPREDIRAHLLANQVRGYIADWPIDDRTLKSLDPDLQLTDEVMCPALELLRSRLPSKDYLGDGFFYVKCKQALMFGDFKIARRLLTKYNFELSADSVITFVINLAAMEHWISI
jgi:hypothetical protein